MKKSASYANILTVKKMLKIAICDDDWRSLDIIKRMLERWSKEHSFLTNTDYFDNGDELIKQHEGKRYDIIFLDIVMPLLNGIDTAKELREFDRSVKIIFLTSSPEFALKSYSVKAADYCLKPITYDRLEEVMADCTNAISKEPENLVVKTDSGYQKIYLHDIEYFEAINKRVRLYLKSGKEAEINQPLYTFEECLTASLYFFKCHRSYLVYLPNVDSFNSTEIKTKFGRTIPIARGYAKTFKDAYFAAMFRD